MKHDNPKIETASTETELEQLYVALTTSQKELQEIKSVIKPSSGTNKPL